MNCHQSIIIHRVVSLINGLRAAWKEKFLIEIPKIRFVPMTERIGARADTGDWSISVNEKMVETHTEQILHDIIPHELAHLVVSRFYKNAEYEHGPEWKALMIKFGAKPVPIHVIKSDGKWHTYICECKGKKHNLGETLHNNIVKGTLHYCSTCKGKLKFLHGLKKTKSRTVEGK